MRFNPDEQIPTAADLIAREDERTLMHIMQDFGEEPKAYFIAKAIVETRAKKPILTTGDLIHVIETSSFDPKSKIRVFQAFRIAVNAEFDHIVRSLEEAMKLMAPGGRIAVITFHSLEDRLVKHCFEKACEPTIDQLTGRILVPGAYTKITRKPINPSAQEIETNPRSRSAKLRCIERSL
jgi:16S rRNA (cytosine1402-N4)-methyltransferase